MTLRSDHRHSPTLWHDTYAMDASRRRRRGGRDELRLIDECAVLAVDLPKLALRLRDVGRHSLVCPPVEVIDADVWNRQQRGPTP
jgi:hypothetical protein